MWYILENAQQSYDLSDRLIRSVCDWQTDDGSDDVEDLLDQGADVNRLHGTLLPLHCACMVNDPDVALLLLQRGAQVNAFDGFGRSALHYAVESGFDCIELLIENGAELNITDGNGDTPLHWAAFRNCVNSLLILLSHGANVNAFDFNHETALSWAAKKSNIESIRILLQYNAIPDAVDLNGCIPLAHVVRMLSRGEGDEEEEEEKDEVVTLLVRAMGQFDLRDGNGDLPTYVVSDDKLLRVIAPLCDSPRSLKELCRYAVRSVIGPTYLPNSVAELPVPLMIQNYIQLKR